ncbi:MAG TPA: hypothetical protein VNN18_02995 [Candidatus Xenobia bacterium]|nr:hypothetical protein [Candidatus Xenobia bacterium]
MSGRILLIGSVPVERLRPGLRRALLVAVYLLAYGLVCWVVLRPSF